MKSNKNIVVGIVVVIIIVLIAVYFSRSAAAPSVPPETVPVAMVATSTPTSAASSTVSSDTSAAQYVSTADGFSADFPSDPQVTDSTFTSATAGSIPVTNYESQGDVVYVFHYPASYQFSNDYLEGALKIFVATVNKKYPGTKLTGSSPTQFLGNPALSAAISLPGGMTGDLLITVENHTTYIIGAYGNGTANNYSAFTNSFSFTQ